ncbi:hypothetical protein K435DRAFT_848495 [Dendrothele bispora CBS 962.96]|uniref:Uncharacterized protein n=1 Tax=Dendrothele bispora (strain CBS 962.96) TaxID=1314807 RepID=A0A4S8MXE1_DENBC|nr:hypothetical protein K435DRAFT_848495 [Dendrothele bispora CBS 962.96]
MELTFIIDDVNAALLVPAPELCSGAWPENINLLLKSFKSSILWNCYIYITDFLLALSHWLGFDPEFIRNMLVRDPDNFLREVQQFRFAVKPLLSSGIFVADGEP